MSHYYTCSFKSIEITYNDFILTIDGLAPDCGEDNELSKYGTLTGLKQDLERVLEDDLFETTNDPVYNRRIGAKSIKENFAFYTIYKIIVAADGFFLDCEQVEKMPIEK